MTTPTPAVERAAEEQFRAYQSVYSTDGITVADFYSTARADLTAALTDPDDPDSLARTLWVLDRQALGLAPVSPTLFDQSPSRKHWRAVADGLRMMLTGSGS